MVASSLKERLKDPAYLDLHLAAISVTRGIAQAPWYDGQFLRMFEAAKQYLAIVRPDAVPDFVAGFAPLRTPADFRIAQVKDLFSAEVHDQIRHIVAGISAPQLGLHEVKSFGRDIVHDHPEFGELQKMVMPLVCELTGQDLEPGYNFLSLYGNSGKCDPHLDQPISMYTLDYCIDQSHEWPIYFSDIVDWPTAESMQGWDAAAVLEDQRLSFREYVLHPNEAILFSGSSQWHYRKAMSQPGFCNLLFFHYFPKGCDNLVDFQGWPELFDLPELGALCDVLVAAFNARRLR